MTLYTVPLSNISETLHRFTYWFYHYFLYIPANVEKRQGVGGGSGGTHREKYKTIVEKKGGREDEPDHWKIHQIVEKRQVRGGGAGGGGPGE